MLTLVDYVHTTEMSRSSYDRFLTVFSPEGRIYQVGAFKEECALLTHSSQLEYAFKAISGSNQTAVALRGNDASVVITQKRVPVSVLLESEAPLLIHHRTNCSTPTQ